MKASKALGVWLRDKRKAHGFRSAASLARAAGIATNHVATIERGEARPTWDTVTRLATALALDQRDRDEFFALADAVSKPPAVTDAMRGVALPGLVLWRHLPHILHDRLSDVSLAGRMVPDEVLFHGVRSIGSTLAWVALRTSPPSDAQVELLRRAAAELKHDAESTRFAAGLKHDAESASFAKGPDPLDEIARDAMNDVITGLPHVWRVTLFASERSAQHWGRMIDEWDCVAAGLAGREASLSLTFRDSAIEAEYGFHGIAAETVAQLHDVMTAFRLSQLLRLISNDSDLARGLLPHYLYLNEYVTKARETSPDGYFRELSAPAGEEPPWPGALEAVRYAEFAMRLFALPPLAEQVFGAADESTRQAMRKHLADLDAAFRYWFDPARDAPCSP
ncbi:MAG: helix-turn-helix domain-containing protein [Phycisphaerae bacterium]